MGRVTSESVSEVIHRYFTTDNRTVAWIRDGERDR
jgi:ABC-type iron transport system FetAB ATPase subunit